MSVKTPSAVVAFENVPEDAADPVVDVYVNGEKVDTGGGGGGDITVFEIGSDMKCNVSVNELRAALLAGMVVFKDNYQDADYALGIEAVDAGENPYVRIIGTVIWDDLSYQTTNTYQANPSTADTKPIEFYIPD